MIKTYTYTSKALNLNHENTIIWLHYLSIFVRMLAICCTLHFGLTCLSQIFSCVSRKGGYRRWFYALIGVCKSWSRLLFSADFPVGNRPSRGPVVIAVSTEWNSVLKPQKAQRGRHCLCFLSHEVIEAYRTTSFRALFSISASPWIVRPTSTRIL